MRMEAKKNVPVFLKGLTTKKVPLRLHLTKTVHNFQQPDATYLTLIISSIFTRQPKRVYRVGKK